MGLNWNEIKSRALLFSKTWADASNEDSQAIKQVAQAVLDARIEFADASLADQYDPLTMPPALLKGHQKLGACRAWGVESEKRPQQGQFLPAFGPIARLWGQKRVKNGPLRPFCSRRSPSPTGS
jgi:hypothetical protein